jgi:CspA family cold shock protein
MHTGNVRWFDQRRGYGFIQPADGYRDIFIHRSALERAGLATLQPNQVVIFEVVTKDGHTQAEDIVVLN